MRLTQNVDVVQYEITTTARTTTALMRAARRAGNKVAVWNFGSIGLAKPCSHACLITVTSNQLLGDCSSAARSFIVPFCLSLLCL